LIAKPGLMITPLSGKQALSGLSGFEFKVVGFDIPASKYLPEGENSIPFVIQDLNNMLNL
jgi:hypothetical protein